MSDDDALPVLQVHEGIEFTEDERLLIDGVPVPPGRYRLQLGDAVGELPVLAVAGGEDDGPAVVNVAELLGG